MAVLPGPGYPAPAKLNLFLHVVGRREDGYHLLQSVFTLIDRQDTIRLRVREDGVIARVNDVAGVPEAEDLSVRAARLLQEHTGTRLGVDIELEKRIPMGGGLGGGSSDAATVLRALDGLWGLGLGTEVLGALGQRLGADVPFFVFGRTAWVEGIGERLRPFELPPRWYVVLVPPVHVPTPLVFGAPELTRNTEPLKMEDFSARDLPGATRNDLERVVVGKFPEVARCLTWLKGKSGEARLTGSGGCVFAGFDQREQAERVLRERPASMEGFVAQGIAKHPLAS
ncbi:4-diphosphocytidyl-2-C-methyl-D-erythritol kinase [Usitatibacter rugosus]|uniref:4-diphosphocytidyl-2-C-methyl-D-erythritol kinase n=1 Tax=Usitatibacter rugosus TaxID=2732067 RepID=A0A6M4GQK0_9PROT|nr:4-(cytidine 5'-diphospho)-2-C-methyl-D-erythritol kinase [Usitatibacter rugosus]QJR09336.1 4-diphosphocytidyl-2-C-methyl-D-erythritol kinase [Usitatibacter rugosus]